MGSFCLLCLPLYTIIATNFLPQTPVFCLKIILIHSVINFVAYPYQPFLFEIGNDRYECLTFFNVLFYLGDTHLFNVLALKCLEIKVFFGSRCFANSPQFITIHRIFYLQKKGLIFSATILAIISTFSTTNLL